LPTVLGPRDPAGTPSARRRRTWPSRRCPWSEPGHPPCGWKLPHVGLADDDVRGQFGSANRSLPTSDTRCLRSRPATPIASATSTASSPSCSLDGTSRLMRWSSPRGNVLVGLSVVRHPCELNCQEGPLEPTEGHPPQGALRCAGPP